MRRPRVRTEVGVITDAAEELQKLETMLQQLERAELYVVAALDLELEDPFRRRLLEDLRSQVTAVRRSLTRPRVIDQAFNR